MFLALKEMHRAKLRFGMLMAAVGLLVFLVLFQQSLQNGLLTAFVGGIRNQSAPVIVYSVDGRRNLQGGAVVPELQQLVESTEGVAEVGRLSLATFTATVDGSRRDAALVGYEAVDLGAPAALSDGRFPSAPGEAVANEADAGSGFAIGDIVVLEPAGPKIAVVGLARDIQINATPTLFVGYDTYEAAVRARSPEATELLPNALAVRPSESIAPDTLVASINARSVELDALTRADAADRAPGVSTVRQSFTVIFLLYGLVIPLVTGLFFLIITFQKAAALTLLRAIGAPARALVRSLLLQVAIVLAVGLAVGIACYAPISTRTVGSITLRFETRAVLFWSVLIMVFGILSSLVSARRVLAIDPVDATNGARA
jgi:putative ABC transport system permease protein